MPAINPFTISVPDKQLKLVKDKLGFATFPPETPLNNDWAYGAPVSDVKRLVNYWANGFDWRAQESKLNELPQFETDVEVEGFGDVHVHFLHQRSDSTNSIPLLFCHGWPGSFLEVLKILPLLTNPQEGQSFHVVAPSLPNFGFSGRVNKPGFGVPQYAETMHKIMIKLGYNEYVTQGGDWGYHITRLMGIMFPHNVLASHLNMIVTKRSARPFNPAGADGEEPPYTEAEKAGLERTKWFNEEGYGYNLLQSTRPATIGFAFADSPVAQLSWIYEKLHDWTDNYPWTDDEVLTWVSMYHFSAAGPAASAQIYYEAVHSELELMQKRFEYNPHTKLGISHFPRDLSVLPSSWAKVLGPVVFEARHERGGHFAAHEVPELLVGDLRKMFGEGGGAHDIRQRILKEQTSQTGKDVDAS